MTVPCPQMNFKEKFWKWASGIPQGTGGLGARIHLSGEGWRIYVRRSIRRAPAQEFSAQYPRVIAWDLASIDVAPNHRRRGYFKAALSAMEEFAQSVDNAVIVENVLNPHLQTFLDARAGWELYDAHDISGPTYIRYPVKPVPGA